MTTTLHALSLSYKKAPLAIREQLALDEPACQHLLAHLTADLGLTDVLVLSTCNRTEVYYSAATNQQTAVLAALGRIKNRPDTRAFQPYCAAFATTAATAQHLFEVALGLDAQVLGDAQIINQVKRAYQRSAAAQAAGPLLHRLLHTVFAAHKRVLRETAFRDGAASAASAALELVGELTAATTNPNVLVVGLGEIGADVCRYFAKNSRFAHVTICNRSPAPAAALAAECGLPVLDFADLPRGLAAADVVISGLAAPAPFFTRALLAALPVGRPRFFIDLAVPRSVAAEAGSLPGVFVYNIDDIQGKALAALARRQAAVPQVRAIVAENVAELLAWHRHRRVLPAIQQLKNTLEHLRQQELGRFGKGLGADEAARLDAATRALTQKFLKLPVLQLKAACERGEASEAAAMLTALFGLETLAMKS